MACVAKGEARPAASPWANRRREICFIFMGLSLKGILQTFQERTCHSLEVSLEVHLVRFPYTISIPCHAFSEKPICRTIGHYFRIG